MDIARVRKALAQKNVLVVGAGGLGCHVIEHLARCGVGALVIMDGDRFSEGNMNRQLYCTGDTLGSFKASVAAGRVAEVGGLAVAVCRNFCKEEVSALENIDLVVDCVDNVATRLLLARLASERGLPLVHGAICGLSGQIAVVEPGSGIIERLYPQGNEKEIPTTLSFAPAVIGALQASEAVKVLAGEPYSKGVTFLDLTDNSFQTVQV